MIQTQKHQARAVDTSRINKSPLVTFFDMFFIGKIAELRFGGEPFFMKLKNLAKYGFDKNIVQNLDTTEISYVEEFCYSSGSLFDIYKLEIPNLFNSSDQEIEEFHESITSILHTLSEYKSIELFYYDRKELLSDYDSYLSQIDIMREKNLHYTKEGKQLSNELRANLEEDLQYFINASNSRARECFLIISEPCNTNDDVTNALNKLRSKKDKLISIFDSMSINNSQVKRGKNLDWLMHNFVSHRSRY